PAAFFAVFFAAVRLAAPFLVDGVALFSAADLREALLAERPVFFPTVMVRSTLIEPRTAVKAPSCTSSHFFCRCPQPVWDHAWTPCLASQTFTGRPKSVGSAQSTSTPALASTGSDRK